MKKIILSILLLLNFKLEAREFYAWADHKDHKLFCFDRETETLIEKDFIKIKSAPNYPALQHIGQVIYVSNFIVADYVYSPYSPEHVRDYRTKGGYGILDIRDGSYREIEVSDLVSGYFSTAGFFSDKTRTKLFIALVNVLDWGMEMDDHEVDNFIWDINNGSSPVKISYEEYSSQTKTYSTEKSLGEAPSTNDIPATFTNRDIVFVYNDVMLVWAHLEGRYYTLRSMPDFTNRSIRFISVSGNDGVKVWYSDW